MAKKRSRKFLLTCMLILFFRSSRVNADLFVEEFMLLPISSTLPKYRNCKPQCRNYGFFKTPASLTNNNDSHFEPDLNCTFKKKKLQKKFQHAKKFGVSGNCSSRTINLFERKLIEHMRSIDTRLFSYL
jgi:hypothetical protein